MRGVWTGSGDDSIYSYSGYGNMMIGGDGNETITNYYGGNNTVDGGIGCAQACGLPVLLEDGEPVSPTEPLCGRDLAKVILIKHGRGKTVIKKHEG